MKTDLLSYGATIMSVEVPDRFGIRQNVVAGFRSLAAYQQPHPYFGSTIGRFANRIAGGKFSIDGIPYALTVNEPPNHLHGGYSGFDKKVWRVINTIEEENRIGVRFGYTAADGEEGYPGNLQATAVYFLTAKNELQVQYTAAADKATIVHLTNHSYFNLSGFKVRTIHAHRLQISADYFLKRDFHQIPTGEMESVRGSALDFTREREIGDSLDMLKNEIGIDHTFVIRNYNGGLALAAELSDTISGRHMKVYTNQPGMHIYTANWWDGKLKSDEISYEKQGAVAMEAGAFPDAPNHRHFPSTIVRPGDTYQAQTVFQFF